MARVNLPASQPFYDAAQRLHVALRGEDSLLAPGQPIWSTATLDKLYHDFVESPTSRNARLSSQVQGSAGELRCSRPIKFAWVDG